MNNRKSLNLVDIVIDEIALEGLDGITLEALWQRLAMRLGDSLPLKEAFMDQIWDICLIIDNFAYYELETPRENLVIFDRYELEYLNIDSDKECEYKDIYLHEPIEDVKLGNRGSCSSYNTRKDISSEIKSYTLNEVNNKYGQKLVIVASQSLREYALMGDNISSTTHIPLAHYCFLERIGRARTIGEITLKKSSNIKEDAKALFYIRKVLQDLGLIRKQVYYQASCGANYNGQNTGTLVHLTRFFNTRKPKVIMWAEHLINYLKSKENYVAEYNEVKNELNLDYTIKKFFKVNILQKVFRTDVKVPYRSYYPNSAAKDWATKSNASKERIIKLVTLSDPNIEISDLWRTEEVQDDDDDFQLDIRTQQLNVPFLKQIYNAVESKEFKGASQSELGAELGYTKLISRTLVRNLVKAQVVSTYLDDIGRQRTTKFVSRKFDGKSSVKKQIEEEISKIKEYNRAMQNENSKSASNSDAVEMQVVENENLNVEQVVQSKNDQVAVAVENLVDKELETNSKNEQSFVKANNILSKYKLFRNHNRYRYTSKSETGNVVDNEPSSNQSRDKQDSENNEENIVDSDFYKTIETKLIVQKPECKKKSQKHSVVGFMENVHNSDNNKQSNLSYRLLRRANLVIESVKRHKIIEDSQKLIKFINKEEDKEGVDTKIDKNSLMRLLQKLAEDNFIKYIKLVLKSKDSSKQKVINFICDPSVAVDDSVILSAVEKAKLRFCMLETQPAQTEPFENNDSSMTEDSSMKISRIEEKMPLIKNNEIGKKHGYCPKFIRMKWMHIFLYHLIYDHPGHHISKNVFLENMRKEEYLSDALDLNIGNIYTSEISWKMFIPVLPKHTGYPQGWALMSDVLLRMPLSIFVKVYNVNYEVPGLQELLDHPIKQHILMKDVPAGILNLLFIKRKYMFSIHEIVTRLCYLGLVQFGAQVLKEKDQIFIYLNRHSELLDTTSSAAGYHRVEDKPYPMTKYHFTTMDVVENYWYEMWNTCINTCLGGRSVVEGKDILLEDLMRKVEMIQASKMRSPDEAIKLDTGFVPGDRKGAAGIDSAFFAHLKRNWNWVSTNNLKTTEKKPNRPVAKPKSTCKVSAKPISKLMAARGSFPPKKRTSPLKQNQTKTTATNKSSDVKAPPKLKREKGQLFPVISSSRPPKIIRKVLPRKPMRKRVKYDEIDFSALQRMDKLRVDWEQHEDNILLVCKVAMVYLCPNPRRNIVSFTAIRDILRSYSFSSHNKTSRACQRRLLYMLKQPKTVNSVLLGVEEVKQDYFVNKRFGRHVDSPRGDSKDAAEYEQRIEKIFKELVTYIAKKYYNISDMERREPVPLPKTIQEFNLFHKLKLPTKIVGSPGVSTEVRQVNDIHTCTINSVIHSSMCCGKERRSWAYQLFKVYQQYPEYLLRSAMFKIRADQMVTMKKNYMCAHKKFGNCMPMSSSQYQLSSSYYYKFQTKWPYQVFSESYNVVFSLLKNYAARAQDESIDSLEMRPGLGGVVAAIHDYASTDLIDVDIEIPDQIIMLDPGLPEKDEVYQRIALRYQTILDGLNSDYLHNKEAANLQTNVSAIRADTDQVEPVSVIEEQQSFVQIRSAKRTLEQDNCLPENAKKQKLDSESVMKKNDESYKSENEKIQSNVSAASDSVQSNTNSKNEQSIKRKIESVIENVSSIIEPVRTTLLINATAEPSPDDSDNDQNMEDVELDSDGDQNSEDIEPEDIDSTQCLEQTGNLTSANDLKEFPSRSKISAGIRVSSLLKRTGNREIVEDAGTRTEVHDVRTRQTRIAMLKMREELHDLTFHDSHHAHEYFVVNSFKLLFKLMASQEDKQNLVDYRGMDIPSKLLPIDVEVANQVLQNVKKHAIFPKSPVSYEDFKKEMLQDKLFVWEDVNAVCKYIRTKTEFGATLHELVTEFKYFDNKLANILSLLTEKRIVLRAGIVTVRYIHYRYVNPWIIHSYKILRLEKESHQTVPEGSVYVLDNDEGADDRDKEGKRVTTAANLFYNSSNISATNVDMGSETSENRPTEDSTVSENSKVVENVDVQMDEEKNVNNDIPHESSNVEVNNSQEQQTENAEEVNEEPTNQKRLRRNRTVLLKQKDIYRAAKLLDFNTAEEIKVVIKPWIRIDGVVNRRVLDRMLGAVLCYCIEKPGTTLTLVQNRFTPAIQPYHTRELIEILVKLGCVKTMVQKMPKVTLFSQPAKLDFSGNPDLVADSDTIVIEATVQATLRFGMFLSNRSYSLDFLSSL
ncbi:general transcription factor 3C polypeptide 1 [Nasonia vitripennis]|uniref:General transcription factor 3C polypeptide 1 n=1 Tax=Nasonia vitripennis TaxID=7425 RepID=A0A7M7HD10_NASVI|nr:general transcription factor 3C polypeptide 1 [Nasonia vitripennis]